MRAFGCRFFAVHRQFFQGVLANSFQHREAGFSIRRRSLQHQAFIEHRSHTVEQVQIEIAPGVANRFDALQIAAANEDRETPEEFLLGGIQQLVAPIHGCTERLLALREVARPAGQQLQPAGEPGQQGSWRKNLYPGGGEFDGQGQSIEPRANFGDGCGVFTVQLKVRLGCHGALDEQRDGGVARQIFDRRHLQWIRQRERRNGKFVFAVKVQRGPAGNQNFQVGTHGQEFGHGGRRRKQVFEIIEQQQHRRARRIA